jgi:magnesium-transporting ATPase (P-type)
MNQKLFRSPIVLYATLTVAGAFSMLLPAGYSKELSDALDKEPITPLLDSSWFVFVVMLPLVLSFVAGLFGLYMFKSWGRSLSLYSTLAGIVLFPFLGPSLYGGLESAIDELASMILGAILALSYYSNISAKFSANNSLKSDANLPPNKLTP